MHITLLDINIHFQPRNRRSESKYIYIKPILLPPPFEHLVSAVLESLPRGWDTPQIKRGANGDGLKEGSHVKLKYPSVVMIRW